MNILAFCAHPDDIELNVGGTLLKYKKQGHKIYIALTTSGNTGSNIMTDVEEIGRALDAQADGILLKSDSYADVVKAIRAIAAGHKSISRVVQKMLAERQSSTPLSERQMEVLSAMCRGLTNADIAKMLGITPDGVKFHITAILAKLDAANRSEAVAIALKNRLLGN